MIIWHCKAHLGVRKMRYRNKLLLLLLLLLFVSWFTAFARSFRPKLQKKNAIIDGTIKKPFAERDFMPLNEHGTIKKPLCP